MLITKWQHEGTWGKEAKLFFYLECAIDYMTAFVKTDPQTVNFTKGKFKNRIRWYVM